MRKSQRQGPVRGPAAVCLPLVFLVMLLLPAFVLAGSIDDETCISCHDDVGEEFHNTLHGVYFSKDVRLTEYACESCHGDGTAHVEEEDPELIYNPARDKNYDQTETCLSCHRGDMFSEWEFSNHVGGDVNCAGCHTIHNTDRKSLKADTPDLCYGCHSEVRAASFMPSHHPIAENKIECQDCHAIHGGANRLATDQTGNELCFSCHADKEGPFVFEHEPVLEDCMICHTPHGSVVDNLLKTSEPTLCLNCHAMHFHATVTGFDGEFESPQAPDRVAVSTPDGFKRAMLTKCTQCHSQVHGSDLPGQATTAGGATLTR